MRTVFKGHNIRKGENHYSVSYTTKIFLDLQSSGGILATFPFGGCFLGQIRVIVCRKLGLNLPINYFKGEKNGDRIPTLRFYQPLM